MSGLAHPFRDATGRPCWPARARTAETLLAAWRQVEDQGGTVIRWRLSRRLAKRLAREEHQGSLGPGPHRLFDHPVELTDDPDGFGIVVAPTGYQRVTESRDE